MEINSLRDLKTYVNSIPDERLDDPVIVEKTEQFSTVITSAYEISEAMFVDEEGISALSSFEPFDEDDVIENYTVYPKGSVFFNCDNEEEDERWRVAEAAQQAQRDKNLIAQGNLMAQRPTGGISHFLHHIVEKRAIKGNFPDGNFKLDYKVPPYCETMSYTNRVFTIFTKSPEIYDRMTEPDIQEEELNKLAISDIHQNEYYNLSKVHVAFERFGYTWLIKKFENEKDIILPEIKS